MLLCGEGRRMGVSKRTKKLEPNPPQLYNETVTFRTLDHRMVATRVPTGGAKGQDQRRDEEACLMIVQRTQKRRPPPPRTTDTDARTFGKRRRNKPVRVRGDADGIECDAAHKTGARGDTQ